MEVVCLILVPTLTSRPCSHAFLFWHPYIFFHFYCKCFLLFLFTSFFQNYNLSVMFILSQIANNCEKSNEWSDVHITILIKAMMKFSSKNNCICVYVYLCPKFVQHLLNFHYYNSGFVKFVIFSTCTHILLFWRGFLTKCGISNKKIFASTRPLESDWVFLRFHDVDR